MSDAAQHQKTFNPALSRSRAPFKLAGWLGLVVSLFLLPSSLWAADILESSGQGNNDWNATAAWGGTAPTTGNNYITTTAAGSGQTPPAFGVTVTGRIRCNDLSQTPFVNPNVFGGSTLTLSAGTDLLFKQTNGESASVNLILNGGVAYWANNLSGGTATLNGTISNAVDSYMIINGNTTGDGGGTILTTWNITSTLTGSNKITLVSGRALASGATNLTFLFSGDLSAFGGTFVVGNNSTINEVLELNPSSSSMPALSLVVRTNTTLQLDNAITIASMIIFQTAPGVSQVVPIGTYTASQLAALGYGGNFRGTGSVTVTVQSTPPQTTLPVATPSNVVVGTGTPATILETLSGGTPPYSYQWRSNGVNVGTAVVSSAVTNALVVNTAGMALGSYNYSVVVTNAVGSSTSAPVTLNIVVAGDVYETEVGFGLDWNNALTWTNGAPVPGNNYISTTNGAFPINGFGISTVGRVRDNNLVNPNVFGGGTLTISANTELLIKQLNGESASANIILKGGVMRVANNLSGGTNFFGGSISNAADSYLAIWEFGSDRINPQVFDITASLSGSNNLTMVSGSGVLIGDFTNLTFMFSGDLSAFRGTLKVGNAFTSGEVLELNPSNTNMALASLHMNSDTTLQLDQGLKARTLSVFNKDLNTLSPVAPGTYTAAQLAALGLGGGFRGTGSLVIVTNVHPINLQGTASLELNQTLSLQVSIPAGFNQSQTVMVTIANDNTSVASLPGGDPSQTILTFTAGTTNVQTISVSLNGLGTANFTATGTADLLPATFSLNVTPVPVLVEAFRASSLVGQSGLNNGDPVNSWAGDIDPSCIAFLDNAAPIFLTNVLPSGAPAVNFTNFANMLILSSGSVSPVTGLSNFTVVVVFRADTNGVVDAGTQWYQQTGLVDGERTGVQNDWGISINQNGAASIGLGNPDTTFTAANNNLVSTNFHVGVFVYDSSGDQLRIVMDNRPTVVMNNSSLSVNPRINGDITFGRGRNNTNYFNGDIAEIDFYSGALNNSEAQTVISNLSATYGITFPVTTPPVLSFTKNGNGTFTIVSTVPGTLQSTTNLVGAVWQNEGAISGSSIITPSPADRAKFYRVSVP